MVAITMSKPDPDREPKLAVLLVGGFGDGGDEGAVPGAELVDGRRGGGRRQLGGRRPRREVGLAPLPFADQVRGALGAERGGSGAGREGRG